MNLQGIEMTPRVPGYEPRNICGPPGYNVCATCAEILGHTAVVQTPGPQLQSTCWYVGKRKFIITRVI